MLAVLIASMKPLDQSPAFLNKERLGLRALPTHECTQPALIYYLKAIASNNACKSLPSRYQHLQAEFLEIVAYNYRHHLLSNQ
jgi:hypothetical protein